jgi:hypothetical protein
MHGSDTSVDVPQDFTLPNAQDVELRQLGIRLAGE